MPESNLPSYKRKTENWLSTFRDWVLPRTDAPTQYIYWSGIFCIASALRRKVYISRKTLGAWDCYPFMYIMLVGPFGLRKTTAAKQGEELMEDIPTMPSTPTFITQAGLVDEIMNSPDSSVYLLVEEFGDIIIKGGLEMYEFLTSMYDGKKKLHQKTLKRGIELAQAPCINMLAATTPKWIAEKMPEVVIGGGLASRIVWVFEDKLRDPRMYPRKLSEKFDFKTMQDNLTADLAHISENLEGEVTIPQAIQDWVEEVYQKTFIPKIAQVSDKLKSYYARKHVHWHKLAMIMHFARSDTMELELRDFEEALEVLNGIEKNLPRVFSGVGKNPFTLDVRAIIDYVESNQPVARKRILQEFAETATVDVLDRLLQGCVAAGNLEVDLGNDGSRVFRIPTDDE